MKAKGNEPIADLFEDMRIAMGMTYQSDLKYAISKNMLLEHLRRLDADAYSAKEWEDFLRYTEISEKELE